MQRKVHQTYHRFSHIHAKSWLLSDAPLRHGMKRACAVEPKQTRESFLKNEQPQTDDSDGCNGMVSCSDWLSDCVTERYSIPTSEPPTILKIRAASCRTAIRSLYSELSLANELPARIRRLGCGRKAFDRR